MSPCVEGQCLILKPQWNCLHRKNRLFMLSCGSLYNQTTEGTLQIRKTLHLIVIWGHMGKCMSKELRMVTECFLLLCPQPQLSFSPPFRHTLDNREMTSELVILERLSQLASLSAGLLLSVMLFGVFVWWRFLFGVISPLRGSWIQVHHTARPHPTYSTACLLPRAQPDYSCPEMSQPHASGSEYTLSLTRDPDNPERHTLLSRTAPV